MRKLGIAVIIVLLITPTTVLAQTGQTEALLKAYHAKVSQSLTSQDISAESPHILATVYWGAYFVYQQSSSGWWTGLVIMNGTNPSNINVGFFDENGQVTGTGTFSLAASNAQRIGMLSDFLTTGYVPKRGSVVINSNNIFVTTMFVGNDSGGFGMIEKSATSYSQ
jgi:hypothetical protein